MITGYTTDLGFQFPHWLLRAPNGSAIFVPQVSKRGWAKCRRAARKARHIAKRQPLHSRRAS